MQLESADPVATDEKTTKSKDTCHVQSLSQFSGSLAMYNRKAGPKGQSETLWGVVCMLQTVRASWAAWSGAGAGLQLPLQLRS